MIPGSEGVKFFPAYRNECSDFVRQVVRMLIFAIFVLVNLKFTLP